MIDCMRFVAALLVACLDVSSALKYVAVGATGSFGRGMVVKLAKEGHEVIKLQPLSNDSKSHRGQGMTIDELVTLAYNFSNEYKLLDDDTMKELAGIGHKYLTEQ